MKPTMAEALRWLVAHVGQPVETRQVRYSTGSVWAPGPRTLGRKGSRFAVGDSLVSLTRHHQVLAVDATSLTIAWNDEIGEPIHTTTYSEVAR